MTRQGLEEYVSDCVILLDHRVVNQLTSRRPRIVKYRGTIHGTEEYPFLIREKGISVIPIPSLALNHSASSEVVSSGVPTLDDLLDAGGFYRSSTILISGGAGTGKSSIAGHFVGESGRRGDRSLYVALELSHSEIVRNMQTIGVQLAPLIAKGDVRFMVSRPSACGLEMHLATIFQEIVDYRPRVVVLDSITTLLSMGTSLEVTSMVVHLADFMKTNEITLVITALVDSGTNSETTGVNISSLVDSWIVLSNLQNHGVRTPPSGRRFSTGPSATGWTSRTASTCFPATTGRSRGSRRTGEIHAGIPRRGSPQHHCALFGRRSGSLSGALGGPGKP